MAWARQLFAGRASNSKLNPPEEHKSKQGATGGLVVYSPGRERFLLFDPTILWPPTILWGINSMGKNVRQMTYPHPLVTTSAPQ